MAMSEGKALIFSAPSGAGKTTIVKHLMSQIPKLDFSISATTRKPRSGEENGKDYYFLEKSDFLHRIENNQFLEWEEVYEGTFYGTLQSEVDRIWKSGRHVVFDVDVEGGINLKKSLEAKALAIFVKVRNLAVLRERLQQRGSETAESLDSRIKKAEIEVGYENQFDFILINEVLEDAKMQAETKVRQFIQ